MVQAHAHLGYAPRGAGLLYGVLWHERGPDILGWFIGSRDGQPLAAYFMMQDYYATAEPHLLRSAQDDVHGRWLEAGPQGEQPISHPPPLIEESSHELARLQDEFVRHWLFFGDDPQSAREVDALHERDLAAGAINVRAVRLGKFRPASGIWRYDAPGADTGVLVALSKRWPLDFRIDD